MKKPKILVIGSINMDMFVKGANTIADFGQSIPCQSYGYSSGGKGANQAFATAKIGADVTIVGRVGADSYGDTLKSNLKKCGVKTDFIFTDESPTGLAILLVNDDGRYTCYTIPGANNSICEKDVELALESDNFDMIVMQLEMPIETVYATIKLANEKGVPVFLDAGPAMKIPLEKLKGLYILSPNEAETKALTEINPVDNENAVLAAKYLYEKAEPEYVILKLGSRGALLYNKDIVKFIPCFKVDAIDSTAAGDTFGAALAARLCGGANIEDAIIYGHAAAGICVCREGAQEAIPTKDEIDDFIKERT